jgi:hypothetical protein
VINPPNDPMNEHRSKRRQRVLKSGKIIYGNGSYVTECVVRNLSDTGAQLKVPTSVAIPDRFEFAEAGGPRKSAVVIWRKGNMLGVRLE